MAVTNPGSNEAQFMDRCMLSDDMRKRFPDQSSRLRACYQQWKSQGAQGVAKPPANPNQEMNPGMGGKA